MTRVFHVESYSSWEHCSTELVNARYNSTCILRQLTAQLNTALFLSNLHAALGFYRIDDSGCVVRLRAGVDYHHASSSLKSSSSHSLPLFRYSIAKSNFFEGSLEMERGFP